MANLSITASDVKPGASPSVSSLFKIAAGVSGQITAGTQLVTDADGNVVKAIATSANLSGSLPGSQLLTAMSAGYAGQSIACTPTRDILIGATVAVGTFYYLSATAGLICLYSDLVTGNYITQLGWAPLSTTIRFNQIITGVTVP